MRETMPGRGTWGREVESLGEWRKYTQDNKGKWNVVAHMNSSLVKGYHSHQVSNKFSSSVLNVHSLEKFPESI